MRNSRSEDKYNVCFSSTQIIPDIYKTAKPLIERIARFLIK